MSDRVQHIHRRLVVEGEKVLTFFYALSSSDWDRRVYHSDHGWTVKEVLSHFVSSEIAYIRLFEDILSGGSGAPHHFDVDSFNRTEVDALNSIKAHDLLEKFREARAEVAQMVTELKDLDMQKTGRHPMMGVVKLEKLFKLLYQHNAIHMKDVRKVILSKPPLTSVDAE
ncbi:MAG: hypothetical protein GTO18_00995 [Anaerolineales bacterium]|nr:hypothetical protein [Anaerolineales bacterium]